MDIENRIKNIFSENKKVINKILEDGSIIKEIERSALIMAETICNGGTIFAVGNGGSAADAQHIVSELVGRFLIERNGYRAVALSTEGALMTSLANDFGFDEIFARQVEAMVKSGDTLIAISTSGKSMNIIKSMESAKKMGIQVIGLTGHGGGKMPEFCDSCIIIPSDITPRIQECHIIVYHTLCELTEQAVCSRQK